MAHDDDDSAAAGFTALLQHLASSPSHVASPRLLARASCVCRAWRDEARAPAHARVLRFEADEAGARRAHAVCALLERHAAHVEELHAPFPLAPALQLLSPHAALPRLALVLEEDELAHKRAPALFHALLRAAPALARWRVAPNIPNAAPAIVCAAFDGCSRSRSVAHAERATCGLLSPGRPLLDADAPLTALCLPPGSNALLSVLPAVHRYNPDHTASRVAQLLALPAERAHALCATMCEPIPEGLTSPLPGSAAAGVAATIAASRRRSTLLHAAVGAANASTAAVLLRAGADPLAAPRDGACGEAAQPCALHAAAAELSELVSLCGALGRDATDTPGFHALLPAVSARLVLFLLLRSAALERHGGAATACALPLPPRALAALDDDSALPFPLSVLAVFRVHWGGAPVSVVALARASPWVRATTREALAYVRSGDAHAAGRVTRAALLTSAALTALTAAVMAAVLWAFLRVLLAAVRVARGML
jgi:hypothetical protein